MNHKVYLPVYLLIKTSGITSALALIIFLSGINLGISIFLPAPDSSRDILVCTIFAFIFYVTTGTGVVLSQQLSKFSQTIHNIDTQRFDSRTVKFEPILPSTAINELLNTYRELGRINSENEDRLEEVKYSASQVIDTAHSVTENVKKQSDATTSTAAAIVEMSQSLSDVNARIKDVHLSSQTAYQTAKQGQKNLATLNQNLDTVSKEAKQTQGDIDALKKLAIVVESTSESIQSIADQTNLLALNASIEAARAGEMGRGFAVVAEEVRALAHHSRDSADSIVSNVKSVLLQSEAISLSMSKVVDRADDCNHQAKQVDTSFQAIEHATSDVQGKMEIVATNAEQQAIATDEISHHVEKVVSGARNNAEVAKQAETVAKHLKSLTQLTSV